MARHEESLNRLLCCLEGQELDSELALSPLLERAQLEVLTSFSLQSLWECERALCC